MARLLVKTGGLNLPLLELRLGVNRVGRGEENDFPIHHASVSRLHCEFILSAEGVTLHDCHSTNGSFVNGQPVNESRLEVGNEVRLGKVVLLVESTEADISIPKIEREVPAPPPIMLPDGALLCPRHDENYAAFRCTHCQEIMCTSCVRMMRVKGGKPLFLCCICHHKCESTGTDDGKTKKGFFGFLQETVRSRFGHRKPPT